MTSEPLPNASLVAGPPSISLTFSEPIDPGSALIELLDAQLRAVDGMGELTIADGGTRAEVALPPLEEGIYSVSYQVVSTVDGHATEGLFAFVVDPTGAEAPPSIAPISTSPSVDAWAVGARWLALLAALVGLGSLITWWHSGRSTLVALAPTADPRPPWGLVLGGGLLMAVGLAAYLGLSARPITEPAGFSVDPAAAFGWTPFATAMRVAMAGGIASAGIGAVGLAVGARDKAAALAGVCLAVALAGMSAAGHASSLGGPLNVGIDWMHLVAVAAWLGGLPAIYALARRAAAPEGRTRQVAGEMLRHHGRLALVAGPFVVLTGLANSPLVLGSPRELVASPYGNLLLAKAVLVSIALGIGAANHLLLRGRGRGSMAALVGAELAIAALAVMAAATMVTIQPGAARQPVVTGPTVQPAHLFGEAGPSSVHASVSVPAPGTQTYQVTVRDAASGGPRPDVQKVFLVFTPPGESMPMPERVELKRREIDGLYAADGAYTPFVGEWGVDVIVRRAGAHDESVSFALPVIEPSTPPLGPPPDTGVGVPAPLAALWTVLPPGAAGWIPAVLAIAAFLAVGTRFQRAAPIRGALLGLAAIFVLTAGSRWVVEGANRPTAAQLADVGDGADGTVAAGAEIYRANCASCHGTDGEGEGPIRVLPAPAPLDETLPPMTDAEVSYRIANGLAGTPMPAFAASLTDQERRDLVAYLRERWGSP
ncbi:MAG: c-type cytochrome [Chloroflexota bacterium]|nr:c-type cytochrome [Chloroflexota bacterium]